MITKYVRKENFQKYLDKFEKCKNEKNYYILVNYLFSKTVKMSQIVKDFILLLTDDNNNLIFNSFLGNKGNTYKKYINEEIDYNNEVEKENNNASEENGWAYGNTEERVFFSIKVGSSLNMNWFKEENEEGGFSINNWQIILFFICMCVLLSATYYFTTIEEGSDIVGSSTRIDSNPEIVKRISSITSLSDDDILARISDVFSEDGSIVMNAKDRTVNEILNETS